MDSKSLIVRVASTVLAVLAALWIASQIGFGLCLQIIVKVGQGVVGLIAKFFGVGG